MKLQNDYKLIHQWKHMETIITKFNSYETWNSFQYFIQNYVFDLQEFHVNCLLKYQRNI